jgi:hypothetical protein
MEEVLGAHVDDDDADLAKKDTMDRDVQEERQLLNSHLPLWHCSQQQAGRLTGHVAPPACVPLLGYSGYVWYRRRPRAESILLCHPPTGNARIGSP